MTGDCHAPFCGSPGVKSPGPPGDPRGHYTASVLFGAHGIRGSSLCNADVHSEWNMLSDMNHALRNPERFRADPF